MVGLGLKVRSELPVGKVRKVPYTINTTGAFEQVTGTPQPSVGRDCVGAGIFIAKSWQPAFYYLFRYESIAATELSLR